MALPPLRQAVLSAGVSTSLARAYAREGMLPEAARSARDVAARFDGLTLPSARAREAVAHIRRDAEHGAGLLDVGALTVADDQLAHVRSLITGLRDLL